jgi:flagellar hook-basal body complex protein FliE
MNKKRRAELSKIYDRVTDFSVTVEQLREFSETLSAVRDDLNDIMDAEQEAFDNLSEKAQEGDKGQVMSDAISAMSEACSTLDELVSSLDAVMDHDFTEVLEKIDEASGMED